MRLLALCVVLLLAACNSEPATPTYDELVKFSKSCTNKEAELNKLHKWQRVKGFSKDPDDLNEEDRAYNSRLKATIWWYTVECNNEKNSTPVSPD